MPNDNTNMSTSCMCNFCWRSHICWKPILVVRRAQKIKQKWHATQVCIFNRTCILDTPQKKPAWSAPGHDESKPLLNSRSSDGLIGLTADCNAERRHRHGKSRVASWSEDQSAVRAHRVQDASSFSAPASARTSGNKNMRAFYHYETDVRHADEINGTKEEVSD